jgi:PAS domain S-box-containing protein
MKRLFQSLSRTSDGAFIIDGRRRIVFWNEAAEKILGYTAEEVAGLQCHEILQARDEHGRTLCQLYCQTAILAERGAVFPNQDVYAPTRTGEGRWLNVTTFAYSSGDKTIGPVIVHLFRDTTEKKGYEHFVNQVLSAFELLEQDNDHQVIASAPTESRLGGLTARERQVLEHLAQGLGTNDIADTLTISPSTVRNHVQNVLDKLGAHSRLEAIAYAYQHGMVGSNGV